MRFGFIGDALRYLLDFIIRFVPNYGWAIIIFTLVIRLILMPLDVKSKRSMTRMNEVKPQMDALQKKYANDKEKYNKKVSELYKQEKINPLSGCLPVLIQFPILFAMFAVMREVATEHTLEMITGIQTALESGNLDYQPVLQSWLWIKNVFQPDSFLSTVVPAAGDTLAGLSASANVTNEMLESAKAFLATDLYANWAAAYGNTPVYSGVMLMWTISVPAVFNGLFLLPIFACASQFLSTKLMPTAEAQPAQPGKPDSGKLMRYMFPLISLWICATSNAGFALYWVAVNVIQILQQLGIGKWLEYQSAKKKRNEGVSNP